MPIPEIEYVNYTRRPIIRKDLSTFAKSMETLTARHQEAIKQRSAIENQLAQVELNAAEDEWKYDYAKSIRDKIDNEAELGNYAGALTTAIQEGATALTNPALLGRYRANQAYKQFQSDVDKLKVSQDIKDWAKKINPYHYEDKYDDEGNIIGGSVWTPNRTPVESVNLQDLMVNAYKTVGREAGGGNTIYYMDANGNYTTDINKSVDGLPYISKGTKFERLSEDKLREAINGAILATPGAIESLKQDYDVEVWKTRKQIDNDDDPSTPIITDVTDDKGVLLTEEQYNKKRIDKFIKSSVYNHVYTTNEPLAGLSTGAAKMRSKLQSSKVNLSTLPSSAFGYTTLKIDNASTMFSKANNAKQVLGEIAKTYGIQYNPNDSGDDIFNQIKAKAGKNIPQQVFDAYDLWKDYNNKYNYLINNNPLADKTKIDEYRQAIEFTSALDNGIDLAYISGNNKFKNDYINRLNKIWGNDVKNLNLTVTSNFAKEILAKLDGNEKDSYKKLGITLKTENDGRVTISLDRNNYINTYLLYEAVKNAQEERGLFKNISVAHSITNTNNERKSIPTSFVGALSQFRLIRNNANSLLEDFTNEYSEEVNNIPQDFVPVTTISQEYAKNLGLKASEIEDIQEQAAMALRAYIPTNDPMYIGGVGETRKYVDTATDRVDIMSKLNTLLSSNKYKNRITIGIDKRSLGTMITVAPDPGNEKAYDEELGNTGLSTKDGFTIYLPNAINDPIINMVKTNPGFVAKNTLYTNYASGFPITPIGEDKLITNDGLNYTYDTRKYSIPVTEEQAAALLNQEEIFRKIKGAITQDYIATGKPITKEDKDWIKKQVIDAYKSSFGITNDTDIPDEIYDIIMDKVIDIQRGY